ncbi:NAD(P)/FAD-dependent oxidoreductase [Scatolibacter rhodanostii]|uniref:NAD(P)/FAD-dependent oxidoreductase n=1 Tax=Scatolibacter rhodanostii TaxID=2014781 RepID=UPI00278BF29E|nr:FAD-dependent oxidoreductase [Scatolibacter rhodanostii]
MQLIKKSIDARDREDVHFSLSVEAKIDGNENELVARRRSHEVTLAESYQYELPASKPLAQRPVIVGFGPAGMFAALILAQAGQNPIVIERGESVENRQKTVQNFWENRVLQTESNVQFGEGGAGTFSDGKLTTGTKDVRIRKVLEEFVKAGAPAEILYEAKPHLGTDKLPLIVSTIRKEIIRLGGEVRFNTKLVDFSVSNGKLAEVMVEEQGKNRESIPCDDLILAIGHSARDTFFLLDEKKMALQAKSFSVGARIEHPTAVIDRAQYGEFAGSPYLGAADYKLSCHLRDGRGVYTFCMCPGGYVTGAASEEGMVVTNGMSEFARDGANGNSALLVGVTPDDFGHSPLDGIAFQREIERKAFQLAGSDYSAPAQRVGDFLKRKTAGSFKNSAVVPTYQPGVVEADISRCLPNFVTEAMRLAIPYMARRLKGFDSGDALLIAPETRSSSPVRILRNEMMQSLSVEGIYPCGEGAGYAGGITSAAVDGIRCAEKILEKG